MRGRGGGGGIAQYSAGRYTVAVKLSLLLQEIERILGELAGHRSVFRRALRQPALDYCCVSGNEVGPPASTLQTGGGEGGGGGGVVEMLGRR